jgi:PAB-dependent poly(A)-specific ribonuclease subunit 3
LPAVTNLTEHPLHSFFIPDDLRRFLAARQEATYAPTPFVPTNVLPAEVGVYHSLVCLGSANSIPSRVYGHPAPTYRAVSSVDGGVVCLRRIEGMSISLGTGIELTQPGYKLVNEAAFGAIDTWKRMKHANIVGLRAAFTTKAFKDNCENYFDFCGCLRLRSQL